MDKYLMHLFDRIMQGGFGAAIRAGAGFATVSILGAFGLVVLAIVLWAASLTPFGLWAGLPVIAAGTVAAVVVWRRARPRAAMDVQNTPSLELSAPLARSTGSLLTPASRWLETSPVETARPHVKLIGTPHLPAPRVRRSTPAEPSGQDAEDLRRAFDQAFAAGKFDEAELFLTKLSALPDQIDWTRRKQRLVRQQRARS